MGEPVAGHPPHLSGRAPWLRAAVLGANDGLVSTAALVTGVGGATTESTQLAVAAIAALVAGALSMAVGEYVSVSAQRDTQAADLAMEAREQRLHPERELQELVENLEDQGLTRPTAEVAARELTERADPLAVHARLEFGADPDDLARPLQAAGTSALTFTCGAIIPVLAVLLAPASVRLWVVVTATLLGLVTLGVTGARLGGAPPLRAGLRVLVGGAAAMAITFAIGSALGAAI